MINGMMQINKNDSLCLLKMLLASFRAVTKFNRMNERISMFTNLTNLVLKIKIKHATKIMNWNELS